MWLKLQHKFEGITLLPCVCYLPPENSSRYFDVTSFYDHLLTSIYEFQNDGYIFVCGDFNSRCGELEDYIAGVDSIPERNVVDFTVNTYGDLLIEFLINTNFCILNGRNSMNNDFTSVSTKGRSVVDYCLIPHDCIDIFRKFSVVHVIDLINTIPNFSNCMGTSMPDHSLLRWDVVYYITSESQKFHSDSDCSTFDKFDLSNIPNGFMCDPSTLRQLNRLIDNLEQGLQTQNDIDSMYSEWCGLIKVSMYKDIPYEAITLSHGPTYCKRKRRPGKTWWSKKLSDLWFLLCDKEKRWLKSDRRKCDLKSEYVYARKSFDKEVQKAKRFYWYSCQNDLSNNAISNDCNFWKTIGKIGIKQEKKQHIPMEVKSDDGTINRDVSVVLEKWRSAFSSLFNAHTQNSSMSCVDSSENDDNLSFNENISIIEIKRAVEKAKTGKAVGSDAIHAEVVKNDSAVLYMHTLFNVCFNKSIVPSIWNKCIINPIPKSSATDPRDPLSYRGISLASSIYKMYCSILNDRLCNWVEEHNLLEDEQGGFRKNRSTIDQISSLTSIIDTRIKRKLSTHTAFIDFKKAYDSINRDKLWARLFEIGISGKMLKAVKSLYSSISSCVRINSLCTDWFETQCGLRQGCGISPLLFNLFIDDLVKFIKSLDIGISVENEKVCILLYADDIVLLAPNEDDLQSLLDALCVWCNRNDMTINCSKSNVVHFRPKSVQRTAYNFRCGNDNLSVVDKYAYLGLVLNEYLDYNVTAKVVAQSAGRALGLIISKCKSVGGVPYDAFTKLYDSMVWPVINYGAPIWGFKVYSCISAVQNRAMRFFLGVGKYTPNDAVLGEMAWVPPNVRHWKSVVSYWCNLCNLSRQRINKRVALWADGRANKSFKTWFFYVKEQISKLGIDVRLDLNYPLHKRTFVSAIQEQLMLAFINDWIERINTYESKGGKGRNKLRNYCKMKNGYFTEHYCKLILPPTHRSALSKFRCGVAPIRIETGRYEGLAEYDRLCPFCDTVESEIHVLFYCKLYEQIRKELVEKALSVNPSFASMSDIEKLSFVLSNRKIARFSAKTCNNILKTRLFYLCK